MNFRTLAKRSLITASIATALAVQANHATSATRLWIGTGPNPGDDLTVGANWNGGLPTNADTPDFNTNVGANHTVTVGAGTVAGRDWHFNSLGGANTWIVNGTGTLLIGRTNSTTTNNIGTLLTDSVAGDTPAHLIVNANVQFVGTGTATVQIGGIATVGGDMEITTPLDANNSTVSGMSLNTGSLSTNFIKLSGGIKSTNPRTMTATGTGQVILGSSTTWGKNFTLGTTSNVATGNITITAADSLGAAGTSATGYTDILSSNGGIVFDNAAGMTVSEFVWTRGRTSTTAPQISNKSGNNIFSGTLSTEKNGLGTNVVVESQAGGTLTFSPTSSIVNFNDNAGATYTLNLIGAGNGEIQGAITEQTNHPWVVAKEGVGTWAISSNQTYTGNTVISLGTLALTGMGAIANSAVIDVHGPGTFDVTGIGGLTLASSQSLKGAGTVAGLVNSGAGNTIAPGDSGFGMLSISSNLSLSGGTLQFDLSNNPAGSNDKIAVGSNLNLTNSTTVNVTPANGNLGNGTYNLMTYTGSLMGDALTNLSLTGVPVSPRQTFDLDSTIANQINLIVTGSSANLSWVGGVNGDVWVDGSIESNSINWTGHPTNNRFFNGDSVTFGTAGTSAVNVSGPVTTGSMTFNNASGKDYSISGGSVTVGGTAAFNNDGNVAFSSGNVTLNGNTTFGNAGNVNFIGNDVTLTGSATFNNAGEVNFTNGNLSLNALTVNATGAGKVIIANTGTLTLPAAVTVNSGTLVLNRTGNMTYSANFSGAGTIQQVVANSSTVTLSGNNSGFTGMLSLSDGTLKVGSTTALGANAATTMIPNGATLDLNGIVLATGTVNLIGTGIGGNGALTNSNTVINANIPNVILSGDTTIGSNTTKGYNLGAPDGAGVGGTGSFVGNNHNLTVLANQEIDIKNVGDMGVTNIIVNGAKPLYFAGTTSVTGAGEIQLLNGSQIGFYGSGFLNNLNTNTGATSKTIHVMTSANGAGFEMFRGNKTVDSAIILDANLSIMNYTREGDNTNPTATFTAPISGGNNLSVVLNSTSSIASRIGTIALTSDNNTYLGTTTIGGGGGFTNASVANDRITLSIGNGGATGSIGAGAITVSGGPTVGIARLLFNRNNALSIGNDIHGGGNVEQAGSGITTLSGAILDYTGNTTVSAGTLNITGSHTTGTNYSVATGAALVTNNVRATGALTVNGTATINANGGAVGASKVETLTINAGGKLDLKDNDLVVGSAANVTAVRDAIKLGKTNNAPTGITSDAALFGSKTGFGYAMGDDPNLSPLLTNSSLLTGQSFDTDSVLVKYTFLGDADLDGDTDLNDLGKWASNFTGDLNNPAVPAKFWTQGDFDYDGDTDLNDLGKWSSNFTGDLNGGAGSLIVYAPGASASAISVLNGMGITVVPEPSTFVLAGVGLVGLAIASRRKKRA